MEVRVRTTSEGDVDVNVHHIQPSLDKLGHVVEASPPKSEGCKPMLGVDAVAFEALIPLHVRGVHAGDRAVHSMHSCTRVGIVADEHVEVEALGAHVMRKIESKSSTTAIEDGEHNFATGAAVRSDSL